MKVCKKIFPTLALFMVASSTLAANDPIRMGVVVKIGGIPWYNAMDEGIKKEAAKQGIDAWMIGPTAADPALQVRAIEDLIAQKVDVIGVVPNDSKVLEPVLKKAQDAGIKVIVHESPDQKYADWDFELAEAKGFGESYAQLLAQCMGEEGQYAIYVGGLTVPLHNTWADATINYVKAHYPKMTMVADKFGVAESLDETMRTTTDLLAKYPELKGIVAFGSQGPIGAARVVGNQGKQDQTCVLGPFSPGQGQALVNRGFLKGGYIWNPMTAGEVFVRIGKMTVNGEEIKSGMQIEGMGKIEIEGRNILGNALESLDPVNLPKLVELGL